jgi:sugar lactone lactonase YvrE
LIRNIQQMGRGQRLLVFILLFGGGLFALTAVTFLLLVISLNSTPRSQSVGLLDGVKAAEFARLPDDDAYPAAVAVGPDGMVYTGSYKTGVLWAINPADSKPNEIAGTRGKIGSISGLTVAPDGSVYIVARASADPRTSGGDVKRLTPDGKLSVFAKIDDARGFVSPDDVALDKAGSVYVSDRGRMEVWRFNPDGSGGVAWWTPPKDDTVKRYEPTGLAYAPDTDSIIITDGTNNRIYRASVADPTKTELVYQHGSRPRDPGFDGVTVTPDGVIYVAALAQNGIARVDGDKLTYVAGLFRNSSDVDYSPKDHRLYVTNFDSFSIAVPAVHPLLPFALDVISLP